MLEARDAILAVIVPALKIGMFLRRGRALARALQVLRNNRPLQLIRAGQLLNR